MKSRILPVTAVLAFALVLATAVFAGDAGRPVASPFDEDLTLQSATPGSSFGPNLYLSGPPVDFGAALIAAGDYLKAMQADVTEDNAGNGSGAGESPNDPDDAGWDWRVTSPPAPFFHTTTASPKNLYGVTALGLYYAYKETGDGTYFTAMQDAADYMKSDAGIRSAADLIFLLLFNDLPGVSGTAYADAAKAKFDGRIATYGSAKALAEYIRDVRGVTQGYPNGIIAWDIGPWVRAAAMLADEYPSDPYDYAVAADSMAEVLWQDSFNDNPGYFDVEDDDGWDSTYANVNYWWYTTGLTGLIDAFSASNLHTSEIPGLVTRLLASQYPSGAISDSYGANPDNEDWQSTAYAAMALGRLDQETYQVQITAMGHYMAATQDASGGWRYSSGNHYPEICGECASGVYFSNDVTLAPATALAACGDTISYEVSVGEYVLDLMGADYKLNYDAAKLTFLTATVGSLLNTGPSDYFFAYQLGAGFIQVNSAHLGTSVDGPGQIAVIKFVASGSTSPGSTALTFSGTELRDSNNETLPARWTGASVVIDCVVPTILVALDAPPSPWTCYNFTPTVDISAGDDYDLDCIKYKIDVGAWVEIVCGLSGTAYTNNDWPLPDFAGLTEGSHTYYFKATDDAGNESAVASVTFTKDTIKPSAATGFKATVGHNKISLAWTNPGTDVNRIYLYRNDWTDYPEYAPAGDPGYPTVASYDWLQDVGAVQTYVDASFANNTRGIYAYRAVVYDCAGNCADPTAPYESDHDRATSYYLGDMASVAGSWLPNFDGLVDPWDFNPFSGCYWQAPPAGSCNEADIGPTIEPYRGRFGIPTPDDYIGFEDLMIFAMNYSKVAPAPPMATAVPNPVMVGVQLADDGASGEPGDTRLVLREISSEDGLVQMALAVQGTTDLKGLSAEIEYDHAVLGLVSVAASEALMSGSAPVLFMGDAISGSVRIDLAVLGDNIAIGGNGAVALLTFTKKENGGIAAIKNAEARDVNNASLAIGFENRGPEPGAVIPKTFALSANVPNPFRSTTVITYDLPKSASVKLTVYNIHGQVVSTLVDQVKGAGRYAASWNALDASGRPVSPGIYFCQMRSPGFMATQKMLVSR